MAEATIAVASDSRLERFVESERFKKAVILLIVINAVLLGVETAQILAPAARELVVGLNQTILGLFVIELILRITALRGRFFRDSWNVFDFVIVVASLRAPGGNSRS
jgi:voltage-gated sodium channel